jgi:hypothetical protein
MRAMNDKVLERRTRRFPAALVAIVGTLAGGTTAGAVPSEFAAAIAASDRSDFTACSAEFEKVAAAAEQNGLARRALYGGAVCATLAGDRNRAFGLLQLAIRRGFHDRDRFYGDPRLVTLRADPRWPMLERELHLSIGKWRATINPELATLVAEDQTDRRTGVGEIDWKTVGEHDRARRKRVLEILDAGDAKVPDDWFNAALVLQHGDEIDDYKRAHELALRAAEADADLPGARWLAAATLDRMLVDEGKPQKYGTQSILKDGKWVLAEVDPSVTDEERAEWDVPTLAESQKSVEEMASILPPPSGAAAPTAPEPAAPEAPPESGSNTPAPSSPPAAPPPPA